MFLITDIHIAHIVELEWKEIKYMQKFIVAVILLVVGVAAFYALLMVGLSKLTHKNNEIDFDDIEE